jgi:hypothetical protein
VRGGMTSRGVVAGLGERGGGVGGIASCHLSQCPRCCWEAEEVELGKRGAAL